MGDIKTSPAGDGEISSQGDFGLREAGQIAVTVRDIEAATRFYRDILGMNLLMTTPEMVFFDLGTVRLMLAKGHGKAADQPSRSSISGIYYRVADIAAATDILKRRGVVFVHDPRLAHRDQRHELWLAFMHDMDGNVLALMEERPLAA